MHFRRILAPSILALSFSTAGAQQHDAAELAPLTSPSIRDSLAPIAVAMPARRTLARSSSPATSSILTNETIIALTEARFSSATIIAAMDVNQTVFDVSPGGLLSLKQADVPDRVIETMIRIEADRRAAEVPAEPEEEVGPVLTGTAPATRTIDRDPQSTDEAVPTAAARPGGNEPAMTPETVAMLSEAIKRLAAEPASVAESTPATRDTATASGPGPHAWIAADADKIALESRTAEVALTDNKGRGSTALSALRGLGEKALAFATPALGIASELELGGLFRNSDPKMTAVWALPGASAARRFDTDTVLEVDFNNIPGIDPDAFRPQVIELVPTRDNYRLVGAARARLSEIDEGLPDEPIIEEPVASEVRPIARGRYRVTLDPDLPAGEYALVLRPVDRARARRDDDNSLSALMGASGSDILFITWDFSVRT